MIDKADKGNPNSKCIRGVTQQASLVSCLAMRHSADEKIKSTLQAQYITTQNANALAILGYAATAIMCEKLTIASRVKIEI